MPYGVQVQVLFPVAGLIKEIKVWFPIVRIGVVDYQLNYLPQKVKNLLKMGPNFV